MPANRVCGGESAYRRYPDRAGTGAKPVLAMDFETADAGTPAARLLRHDRLALAPGDGVNGSTGLRADYVGYDRGSERIVSNIALPERGL